MTIHEQTTQAEIIRAQITLLNETIGLVGGCPTTDLICELTREILRLSKLIK